MRSKYKHTTKTVKLKLPMGLYNTIRKRIVAEKGSEDTEYWFGIAVARTLMMSPLYKGQPATTPTSADVESGVPFL